MIKISCIIPTYNEEPRIHGILSIVAAHPLVHEVIVVDDGSKDKTHEVVREIARLYPKVKLIIHEVNKGKSKAICTGVRESTGTFLMFIDADLIGVTEKSLTDLIDPVISGKADITISLRKNAPWLWHWIGLDYISGERVMPREFVYELLDKIERLKKFGLEAYINRFIIKYNFRIKVVQWPNVSSPYKYIKSGKWKGFKGDVGMMVDIFATLYMFGIFGPLYEILVMKHLEVK
jgi:glycosyltransferase involved in cell wall biosynthesis